MDPVSSAASIISVLQLSADVVKYIVGVVGFSKERKRLREEILGCESILLCLQDNADDPEQEQVWRQKLQALEESPETPLSRLTVILNAIKAKTEPKRGLANAKAALRWPFDDKELQKLVEAVEREKSLLQLALTYEYGLLIKAIKTDSGKSHKLLLELTDMIKEKSTSLEDGIQELHKHNTSADEKAILNWLSPIEYASQYADLLSRRQEGTGQWFLESAEFQGWLNNKKQNLFCPGIPGAGKTIITSIAVEKLYSHFQDSGDVGIAYLYCNFRRKDEQDTVDLLANVLKQLVQNLSTLPESLTSLHSNLGSKSARPSIEDISKAILSVAALQTRTFVLIDALDECQPTTGNTLKLLTLLFNIQAKCGLSIFATSRFIPEILEKFNTSGCDLLEIRARDDDVRKYLQGHMSRLPRFMRTRGDLREEITTEITKFADGMFLLAQLSLSSLEDKLTPRAMKTAIAQLRNEVSVLQRGEKQELLSRAYGEAMERIQSQKAGFRVIAERALSWIICAKRQLTTTELRHALAIEPNEFDLDIDNLPDAEDIVLACAGLVTVDEHTGIIRLVHYTAQEYFEMTWQSWFPDAQSTITEACVTYLSFKAFELGWCPTDKQFDERLQFHPLYEYAARNWGHHAREGSQTAQDLIVEFLKTKANVAGANQAMMISPRHRYRYYSQKLPRQLNGLHIAAYFGLDEVIPAMLKEGFDPSSKDSYANTPILWAASRGHEAVVQALLAIERVDPDVKARNDRTPLSWAAAKGYDAVVKLFLDNDRVDVNSKDTDERTPLLWAVRNGCETVVEVLLSCSRVDLTTKDKRGLTARDTAAKYQHFGLAKLIFVSQYERVKRERDERHLIEM